MYTQDEINLIVLSSFNLQYNVNRTLLDGGENHIPDFENHKNYLIKTLSAGVYNKVKEKFFSVPYRYGVLEDLGKRDIKCVTMLSAAYPETLKNIDDPPFVLYCSGDERLLRTRCFSVVGSRKSLPRALEDCKKISGELSSAFTVVTGLAEGADSCAAQGALDAGGKVISVIANGFDRIYPAANAQLFNRIKRNGLIISEYYPTVAPKPYYFPFRNRIIAGLSEGTLVISAGEKSGALITADYAADYGRDVFVFPYYRGTPSGEGCLKLLKSGAFLFENILDIFDRFSLDFNSCGGDEMTREEHEVFEAIRQAGEAFLPDVAQSLGKPVFEISSIISSLEIKGCVSRIGGNRYCIRN